MVPDGRPAITSVDVVAFRYSNYDTPFWVRPNTVPGRWHLPEDGPTQYTALHPDGAWAELIRNENLRFEDELEFVRMPMWAITVSVGTVVNYSEFSLAEEAGFPPKALVDDDHTRCQREGKRLRDAGFAGVLAPSAALPGTVNLTLFGARVLATWGRPTTLTSGLAACVVAVGGPPPGLTQFVRYRGELHSDYIQYSIGAATVDDAGQSDADDSAQ